jgi:hypothetical protein
VDKSTCGGEKTAYRNLKERDCVEDQNVDRKIILKEVLKKLVGR